MWFLIGGYFVVFGVLAQYMVRHQDKSFLDVIKSWFR